MFIDPIAQATIQNPSTGDEWDFSPVAAKSGAIHMPFMTGLTLMWERKKTGAISITLDAPYQDGIDRIMTPPTPFAIGNYIKARIGYATGEFTDWSIGVLNAGGEGIAIDPNGVTGTVNFAGVARSAHYTASKDIKSIKDYDKLLETIVSYLGLKLEIAPEAKEVLKAMSKIPVDPTAFYSLSSWEVVKKVCELGNLIFICGPHPYNIGSGVRWITITAPRETKKLVPPEEYNSYVMRGVIDVGRRQYPLLSWSPEGAGFATWLAEHPDPAASGIESIYCDTESGVIDFVEILPENVKTSISGVMPEGKPADAELKDEGVQVDKKRADEKAGEVSGQPVKPGADGKEDAKKKAEGAVLAGNPAQTGVISTIGIPSERVENFCNVFGLGAVYDGLYQINKANHIWGPGTYDMSLTVQRFGTGGQEKSEGDQVESQGGQEA